MTRQRLALYVLLGLVGAAAAVLSFSALRDLALLCGFPDELAWLLPVTIDAGAAASSLVWLGPWASAEAKAYGRTLALALLVGSIGGNALAHGLVAYGKASATLRPHWGIVVGVSAIAPIVLGALVHLVVLVGRPESETGGADQRQPTAPGSTADEDHADDTVTAELHVVEDAPARDESVQAGEQPAEPPLPDRRDAVDTSDLAAVIADLRAESRRLGKRFSRDEVRSMYGIGSEKAMMARRMLVWVDEPAEPDRVSAGAAS